jgi:hypothetical protein
MASLVSFAVAGFLAIGLAGAEDKKADWKPLMDGKTLTGWHPVGDGKWTVEDGAFVGRANNEKLYGLLVSDKTFRDFNVRFKFKCLSGDSGFYIRTIIKEPEKANGLQVQVGRIKSGVGGIYESYGRAWVSKPSDELEKSYTKDDQWNEMVIDAHGGNVTVTVNGVQSAELKDDPSRPEGHFALQMHAGCVMDVRFKDIEICE